MPFDFVIGLSLVVVVAMIIGMVYAVYFVRRHIEEDSKNNS